MMTIYDDHILGEHVALLFYDNRAASVDVLVGVGMGEGRKKKNLCRPTLNLQLATLFYGRPISGSSKRRKLFAPL